MGQLAGAVATARHARIGPGLQPGRRVELGRHVVLARGQERPDDRTHDYADVLHGPHSAILEQQPPGLLHDAHLIPGVAEHQGATPATGEPGQVPGIAWQDRERLLGKHVRASLQCGACLFRAQADRTRQHDQVGLRGDDLVPVGRGAGKAEAFLDASQDRRVPTAHDEWLHVVTGGKGGQVRRDRPRASTDDTQAQTLHDPPVSARRIRADTRRSTADRLRMAHDSRMHGDVGTLAPRGTLTWILFGVSACFSYLLTGIGSILAPLQDELGVSRGEVALLPTLFAAALIAVGLVGRHIVARVGRQLALRGAMVGVSIGAVLVSGPGWPLALLGAAVLGASCACLVLLMPVLINALHPRRTTALIAEQNAVNSFSSAMAPLLVGGALGIGLGWRSGYLVPAVLLLLFLPFVHAVPTSSLELADHRPPRQGQFDRAFWSRWLDILLAVSAEFCVLFWIASAFASWYAIGTDVAVVWASTFLAGMVIGRSLGSPVTRAIADRTMIVTLSCGVALAGFGLFWAGGSLPVSAVGALITGLGIALLYPVTIAALMRARPEDPDGASARGTLASGVAIGGAPFLLAALSDQVGLHTAFLIVPVLLVGLLARSLWRQRGGRVANTAAGSEPPSASCGVTPDLRS